MAGVDNLKIIRRSIIGDSRFSLRKDMPGDCDFNRSILDKNPSRYYTGIFAYSYNFPRENSEYDLYIKKQKIDIFLLFLIRKGDEKSRCLRIKLYSLQAVRVHSVV